MVWYLFDYLHIEHIPGATGSFRSKCREYKAEYAEQHSKVHNPRCSICSESTNTHTTAHSIISYEVTSRLHWLMFIWGFVSAARISSITSTPISRCLCQFHVTRPWNHLIAVCQKPLRASLFLPTLHPHQMRRGWCSV